MTPLTRLPYSNLQHLTEQLPPLMRYLLLSLVLLCAPPLHATEPTQGGSRPIEILRIGDSITRYAASDPTLCRGLYAAGISYEMVGSQN
jgi:hypothetical protein